MRPHHAILAGVVLVSRIGHAQAAGAANLLDKVEDVSIYPIFALANSSRTYAHTGFGFEFSFKIGERTRSMSDKERSARCGDSPARPSTLHCDPASTVDTTLTPSLIRHSGNVVDTTFTVEIKKLEVAQVLFELAVGSQSTDLRNSTLVPGWQLTGSVQEFPMLNLYSTFRPDSKLSPYIGATFDQADLKNVKLVQGDSAAVVESSAKGGGATLGVAAEVYGFDLFTEANYSVLRFSTRGWKRPANFPASASPPDFLELTGIRLRLGVQLPLGSKK